jgi:hypothetical protein
MITKSISLESSMINEEYRWNIFMLLRLPESAKAPLWTKITAKETDLVWSDKVTEIVDKLIAARANPGAITGATEQYSPGLKKVDVLEWFEGLAEAEFRKLSEQYLSDLYFLLGRTELICALPVDTCANASTTGFSFGFS